MKDFLLLFRNEPPVTPPSPDEMQASMKKWMDWIGGIAAQGKLTSPGSPLTPPGKVVRENTVITDGPYTELKEVLGGFTIVKGESLDDAAELANGCPVFSWGGSVEVREIHPL